MGGQNIIFAWEELKEIAAVNIDGARGRLMDILCDYQGMVHCNLIVVFDAYRVKGTPDRGFGLPQHSRGVYEGSGERRSVH